MTIDQAIELLQEEVDGWDAGELTQWVGAVELGIEALKRLKDLRDNKVFRAQMLLPGETEE